MPLRYNVSFINKGGSRSLLGPNQGRFFHDTKESAQAWLDACFKNTGEDGLVSVCGEQARGTFRVSTFDCYDHGDAKGWTPEEEKMDPDEALKNAREAVRELIGTEDGGAYNQDAAVSALADAFDALDSWLSKGGFLPQDWQQKK